MQYTRLYAGSDGETHFEDLEMAAPNRPGSGEQSAVLPAKAFQVQRTVGESSVSDWHTAPRRQYIIQLSAGTEREVSDGEVRQFGPGTIILVEDTTGKGHVTRSIDDEGERLMLYIHLPD
jgi:hypothetical protein